ncbi:rod-binding protein [Iodidimonas sp. SYSU 1G8]|uniref:rod-binding protein n=1 Tax=Iodidimonas sp. SYSU 1G8 TaxID=3133967 RepID=UPI0031FEF2C0
MPVVSAASVAAQSKTGTQLEQTAREFEGVFLGQLTRLMMETLETGEFGGGHGEEMFRGVLAEQLGNEMSRRGGIGLAPVVLEQMIRMQESGSNG